jgi:hypothetical protein
MSEFEKRTVGFGPAAGVDGAVAQDVKIVAMAARAIRVRFMKAAGW